MCKLALTAVKWWACAMPSSSTTSRKNFPLKNSKKPITTSQDREKVWSVWQKNVKVKKNALKMRFLLRKLKAYKLVVSLWVCYCKSPLKRFTKKVSKFLLKRGMWRPLGAWVIDNNSSNLTHAQRLWTAVKNVRGAKCQKRGSLPSLTFHIVPCSRLSRFEDRTGSCG